MTNLLGRRMAIMADAHSYLSGNQLQMDAMLQNASQHSSEGILAMAGAGLFGRFVGMGAAGLGARAGFSSLVTRALYQGSSIFGEVAAYRAFTQDPSKVFERNGFASDLLNFGILRMMGHAGQGTNTFTVHALQSGGMVLAQNIAYQTGLTTEAPRGNIFAQLVQAEMFNLKQSAAMGLLHQVTGGRLVQVERRMEIETEVLSISTPKANTQEHFQANQVTFSSMRNSEDIEGLGHPQIDTIFPRPREIVFYDPVAALANPRNFSPYKTGEEIEIAREGNLQLNGRLSGRYLAPEGVRYTLNYYLNGEYVGYLTHQVIPETKTLRLIDMLISPTMQGRNFGKMVMLYHLYQAHVAGWQFTRDLITNQKLIQTAHRAFEAGLPMYLPDARVQKLVMTMDPWEPELIPVGEALPLYETDTSGWTTNNYTAYRITGTPNPAIFASRKD